MSSQSPPGQVPRTRLQLLLRLLLPGLLLKRLLLPLLLLLLLLPATLLRPTADPTPHATCQSCWRPARRCRSGPRLTNGLDDERGRHEVAAVSIHRTIARVGVVAQGPAHRDQHHVEDGGREGMLQLNRLSGISSQVPECS